MTLKEKSSKSEFGKTFVRTLAVLSAIFAFLILAAGAVYLVAWGHDRIISNSYDSTFEPGKDIAWGSLSISLDDFSNSPVAVTNAHDQECTYFDSARGVRLYLMSGCSATQTSVHVPFDPGSGDITGTLRIKNRLWLQSVKVRPDLVVAIFGKEKTSVGYKDIEAGMFLSPGKGTKTKIEATLGKAADGKFALTAGSKTQVQQ